MPTRSGYTFLGWNTKSDGTGTDYSSGASITPGTSDIVLYAKWKLDAFKVSFDTKGGENKPDDQNVNSGAKATRPSQNPTKADNKFLGWTTDSAATTTSTLFDFENTPITAATTLYAIWEPHEHVWAYAADGNKLCAYCTVDGYNCSYYGTESELSKAITVEVNAPEERSGSLTYDGNAYVATITDTDGKWNLTFGSLPDIQYEYKEFGMEAASYSSVTDTKDAGYYKASITVGDKTAYEEYQIAKKTFTIDLSMTDYEVGGTPSTPILTGKEGDGNVTYSYKKKDAADSTYTTTAPTTPWGDYTVKADVAETKNYASASKTCDFKITPKDRTGTINTIMSGYVYGTTTVPTPSTDPVASELEENPSVTYKYRVLGSTDEWIDWTGDSSALDANTYEMIAVIGATATYNEIKSSSVQFTVTKGEWNVTAPTAKTLKYNCADQELVNAGSVEEGGEMLYSLDGAAYNTSISKATNVGTYDVYYKIEADTNHNEYVCDSPVSVTIAKADWNVTAPTAIAPSFTGEALELVNAGVVKDANGSTVADKMLYSLTGNDDDYSTSIPQATNVGSYTVFYKVMDDKNHNEYAAKLITATVEKADRPVIPTVSMQDYTYGQTNELPQPSIDPIAGELAEEPSPTYFYACEDDFAKALEWKDITSKSLNAGTYYMFARIGETETYHDSITESVSFTVKKGSYTGTKEYSKEYLYNGEYLNEAIDLTRFVPEDAGDSSKLSFEISEPTVLPEEAENTVYDAQIIENDFTYDVIGMDAFVENTSTSFTITVKTQNYADYQQVIKIRRNDCEHDYVDGVCSRCDSVSMELCKNIVIKAKDYRYDEASHNPEIVVTYKGEELVNGTDYTCTGGSGIEIGAYDVIVTGKGKYVGSKTVSWNITPTDGIWCADISTQIYTGKAIKPEIKVYSDGTLLTLGKDYTIAYKNNTKAAAYNATNAKGVSIAPTVTITGKGNYANQKVIRTFTISPYDLSGEGCIEAAKADPTTVAYTKKAIKLAPVVTLSGKKLKMGTDYVVSTTTDEADKITSLTNAKKYELYVVGRGNYTGSIEYIFTITDSVPASKVSIGKIANQTYTGEEIKPEVSITYNKADVKDDFDVEYQNNTEVGTATVTVTAKEGTGFSGRKSATFKITGANISSAKIGADGKGIIPAYTYSGISCKPKFDLYIGEKELVNGVDYLLSYKNNVNAGTATVVVTGKGLYTGSKKFSFKINKYDAGVDESNLITVNAGELISVTYEKGGVTPKPKVTMVVNGEEKELKEKTDYTLGYSNNKETADVDALNPKGKPAPPTITITFKGNLSGKKTISFKITKKDISQPESGCKLTASDVATNAKAFSWKQTKITITDKNGKKLAAKTDYNPNFRYFSEESCEDAYELTEATLPTDKYPNGKGWVYVKATAAETSKNYEGSVIGKYYVSGINISSAKAVISDKTYTGSEIELTEADIVVTMKDGKGTKTLKPRNPSNPDEEYDYSIVPGSYTKNINKGTASVTIRGEGDYFGTKVVKFKIVNKSFKWWED